MSVIISIQQEIAAAIAAVPFFSNIPVIAEVLGDLPNQYQIAMDTANASGGKVGAIVIVHTPLANVNFPDMRGPYFDQINVVIEVGFNAELAKISGTGIGGTAMDICENVIVALCAFFPQAANGPLVPVSPTIVKQGTTEDGTDVHTVSFRAQGGISTTLPQLAAPVINGSGTYSISSTTPGAAVFYTLDGSNPSPRNGTLYTAPITPATGQTLKARAWLAGYLPSQNAQTTT